jgi:cell shape-determining protein MreC
VYIKHILFLITIFIISWIFVFAVYRFGIFIKYNFGMYQMNDYSEGIMKLASYFVATVLASMVTIGMNVKK